MKNADILYVPIVLLPCFDPVFDNILANLTIKSNPYEKILTKCGFCIKINNIRRKSVQHRAKRMGFPVVLSEKLKRTIILEV